MDAWIGQLDTPESAPSSTTLSIERNLILEWCGAKVPTSEPEPTFVLHLHISHSSKPPGHVLPGNFGGIMGDLVRNHDWSLTAPELGPFQAWPSSLKTAASIVLSSKIQALLLWGPDLRIMAYSDNCIPTFAAKVCIFFLSPISSRPLIIITSRVLLRLQHPSMLGGSYKVVFREVWPFIQDRVLKTKNEGVTVYVEDRLYKLFRRGFLESCFFTVTTTPVLAESGHFEGVITWSIETTTKSLSNRRVSFLRDLGIAMIGAPNRKGLWDEFDRFVKERNEDLAFAVTYLKREDGTLARSEASIGTGSYAFPDTLDPADTNGDPSFISSRIRESWNNRKVIEIVPPEASSEHKNGVVLVIPITTNNDETPALLVVGTNSSLAFDQAYTEFVQMIQHEVSMAYVNIKSLETAKAQAQALMELDKAKTSFFMSMSHELRTPLGLIIGPVEDCLIDPDFALTENQSMQLELVRKNSVRLLKLVNSLLDIGRLNSGCMKAVFRPIDVSEKTGQYFSMFQSAIEKAGLKYLTEIENVDPNVVFLDEEMWQKIIFNLLGNAIKFTLKGHIKGALRLCPDKKFIEFSVEDTGVGIPDNQIAKVFDQFQRVEYTGGRSFGGSGIGLALVNDLVKFHGGSISLQSTVNVGTTFTVRIPVGKQHLPQDQVGFRAASEETLTRPNQHTIKNMNAYLEEAMGFVHSENADNIGNGGASPCHPKSGKRKSIILSAVRDDSNAIFLVDDNADMRKYLGRILSRYWSIVETFENGKLALEAMKRVLPSLVVSDVLMPIMDGLTMIKEMKSRERLSRIPVILMSGAASGEPHKLSGFENGADEFLVTTQNYSQQALSATTFKEKPVNSRELVVKIKLLLEKHAIRSNLENDIVKQKEISAKAERRYGQICRVSPVGLFACDAKVFGFCLACNRSQLLLRETSSSQTRSLQKFFG
ncbi:hypothetical protein BC830DRAFT_1103147 [Chytriomyces sp. MP71]|nr:hypothetical protein BC830DRAFT_1103147 [Chytriomyces sp. MP71]